MENRVPPEGAEAPEIPEYAKRACHRSFASMSQLVGPDPSKIQAPKVIGGKVVVPQEGPKLVNGVGMSPCMGPACHMWSGGDYECAEVIAAHLEIELKRAQIAALSNDAGE